MRHLILILAAAIMFSACSKTEQNTVPAELKRYPITGKVVSVNKTDKKAAIAHNEIPGYMEAMTMDFTIKDDWVWEDLLPGAEIRGDLVVDNVNAKYWLENLGIISAPIEGAAAPPVDERFAQIGKEIPEFTLTNQDGKRISMKDFRGKALAITFIYRECPLPEYCIKMSRNFSDLANDLAINDEYRDKVALLSVSFDPDRDTPEKLREYGTGYLGSDTKADFNIWQLAVGTDKEVREMADFFGLRYERDENDKTQFNHSLRTAVIAPDGKVVKMLPGNEWTSDDLFRELKAALK